MGQKVHPRGFRLGVIETWDSKWYAKANFTKWLHEDIRIREHLKSRLHHAGLSRVEIERKANQVRVNIHTSRPGIVIGKKGAEVEKIKGDLQRLTDKEIHLNIHEVRKAETDATLVAENVAVQLERRVAFRRAMKRAVSTSMKLGALGVKIQCGGRLGGSEMSRMEWYREGRVPLHTLRARIDFGVATAKTTYGTIGVKCWIFLGEQLDRNAPGKLI